MRYVFGVAVLLVVLGCCSLDWRVETWEQARITAARAQIANFKTALEAYRRDIGDYPSTDEGLQALRVSPGHRGWDGPYMAQDIPRDPWGVPYGYVYQGGRVEITASHAR